MTRCACQFVRRLQISQNAGSATDPVTHLHLQAGSRVKQYVGARTKFDQSHALAALHPIANSGMKHDSSGQQSGDLFEDDHLAVAFHTNDILFILLRRAAFIAFRNFPFR